MTQVVEVKIGEYILGGAAGRCPPALLGTIFFHNQKLMRDPEQGLFDERAALAQIQAAAAACQGLNLPLFLDVVAETPQAARRQVEFVLTRCRLPLFIDASDQEARLAGLERARELGALDRVVYNSLGREASERELEALARARPAAVVISALDPLDYGVDSALAVLAEVRSRLDPGLAGRLLLDVGFLDEASVGLSCRVARELRRRSGLPVGGAPCNGLYLWEGLKARGREDFLAGLAATLGYCAAFGLDFLFAGPLRHLPGLAPALAVSAVYQRYQLLYRQGREYELPRHPMEVLFG